MTQYDDVKLYIKAHPGTTRGMIRKHMPRITHENEILTRLISSGDGYRERVICPISGREVWGYYLC